MTLTATTAEPAEFFRAVDWCHDNGLRGSIRTECRNGYHVVSLTLARPDLRFVGFASQVIGRADWDTHLSAGRPLDAALGAVHSE